MIRVESYERGDKTCIEVGLGGGTTRVLTGTEALRLAHKLLLTLKQVVDVTDEKERMWILIAGREHGQIVAEMVGTYTDLMRIADAMARIHQAAVWAVSFDEITGILAWPRFSKLSKHMQLTVVSDFVERVCQIAEKKMEQTGKLERSHYAAMQLELDRMKEEL